MSVAIKIWKRCLEHSPLSVASLSLLLKDHTSLSIDLSRIASHEMRIVMHHEKTRVDDALADHWDIVEHVVSLLETSSCIDVAAELGTDALEILEKRLSREILCTVETHVLEEVSKTVLVVSLLVSAHICSEIELSSLSRLVVVADVVSHAVLKLACLHSRIVWKYGLTESHHCSKDSCNTEDESFHVLFIKGLFVLLHQT